MTNENAKYAGVTRDQLVARLGRQCSPMQGRDGYVIGPDVNGRICHCSTHWSLGEAQRKAAEHNYVADYIEEEKTRGNKITAETRQNAVDTYNGGAR